jgi:hypothetical protein
VSASEQRIRELHDALSSYIDTLAHGTKYANDRPDFDHHLARAAEMFSAIHTQDFQRLREIVDSEVRYFGHTYLRPPEGEAVSRAWERLGRLVLKSDD